MLKTKRYRCIIKKFKRRKIRIRIITKDSLI